MKKFDFCNPFCDEKGDLYKAEQERLSPHVESVESIVIPQWIPGVGEGSVDVEVSTIL